jgi:multicomponent Na+:H+ antiporter subunit C
MTVVTAIVAGTLVAAGVHLVLQRSLTRIIVGVGLLGHGANLLLLAAGGPPGVPPFVGAAGEMADPLPQAMVLTAIVISFGLVIFLLSLSRRSFELRGTDEVEDDLEDRRIAAEEASLAELRAEPFEEDDVSDLDDLGPLPPRAGGEEHRP